MIVSASRRTDIPAFYSEWFINRVREGYCCVVNPFNANQISRVSLQSSDIDVIVFWTKNAAPLIPYLTELDNTGYKYYFQYSVNGYPKDLEPDLPSLDKCIQIFCNLSDQLGPDKVIWRYDPVLFTDLTSELYHSEKFRYIADALSGKTSRVVISIADEYRAAKGRLGKLGIGYRQPQEDNPAFADLMCEMASIAESVKMDIFSCSEIIDLTPYGITAGKCVDNDYIKKVFGIDSSYRKDKTQRLECGCVASKDIGCYDSCLHGCSYCYATRSKNTAVNNYENHYPDSPSLIGRFACPPPETSTDQIPLF